MLNVPFSMIRIGGAGHVDKCVQQGVISAQDAERWWQHLEEAKPLVNFTVARCVYGDRRKAVTPQPAMCSIRRVAPWRL